MPMTIRQIKKLKSAWTNVTKELINVEEISGTIYVFGSEIACLRLLSKYRALGNRVEAAYSENLETWFFRLEKEEVNVSAA